MKTFRKIDLFYNGDYLCSTMQSKSCKDAVKKYLEKCEYYKHYLNLIDRQVLKNPKLLKARFSK